MDFGQIFILVCPWSCKRLEKFLNSPNYIFSTLKDQTLKPGLFIN